ncbi:MAG: type II CRISPR RNA-guided endonuclease Cas9 [Caulobacteraceae bacterium]|nr:type II CRISPR RNA-guided endonuclease Cas9 [Caulobacteraceae bacterium]
MTNSQDLERSRFAFDLGTNSIGWAIYRLDAAGRPEELADSGVRLFSDGRNPKDGQSLAAMRRIPRAARRRRDRFVQRRDWLMTLLIRHELMPGEEADRKALEHLDPYAIRGRALDEILTPHEIGRALFHLNQRRGYSSNRIADARAEDEDKGKIAAAGERLGTTLKDHGARTLGEYYAKLQTGPIRERQGVRARLRGQGAKAFYDLYPQRGMLEAEFDAIWAAQAPHHPSRLTEEARTAIRTAIFHQRPLKPPVIGRCTFFPNETRLAAASPTAQAFRIYQELANLEIEEGLNRPRRLTIEERDRLAARLLEGEDLTFGKIRRLLELGGAARINLEEGGRDRLKGDETAARLGGGRGRLKRLWPDLDADRRAQVIARLLDESDTAALTAWLVNEIGATPQEAEAAANFRPPEGHIRLGPTAAAGVVEALRQGDPKTGEVIRYHEAVRIAFPTLHHSDLRTGEVFDRLPDYRTVLARHTVGGTGDPADPEDKRLGRLPNPTVHIGLNQLRRVINALIATHGPPSQIVIELARDLKRTREDKDRAQKENRKNEDANRRRSADLEAADYPASAANLRLYRLWEDLGPLPRLCTYTGQPIGFKDVFSGRTEVEHILPFSRTLDDSMANKTITFTQVNRGKRNLAPEEADWAPGQYEAIQQRADALPRNKGWRFKPGAMERFENETRGFLDRQLNETRHLSRLAREYVQGVTGDENGVWVVTGQLTALLRARWGLNFSNVKDRNNHRHHAIDAATIGLIDRGLLAELARRAGAREQEDLLEQITKDVPDPPGFVAAGRDFRQNVRERVAALIVSHKPEHGKGGALHEDTAYGLVDPDLGEDGNLVYRKAIDTLTANEIERVRDLTLRERLIAVLDQAGGKKADAKRLTEALRAFGEAENIRRVRLLKQEAGVVVIADRRTGAPYKALIPGANHHMDIVEDSKGVWRGYAASVFDVNRKDFSPAWTTQSPGARLIMRLHKGDMVEVNDPDGIRRIKRVVRINPAGGRLYLAAHDEGGALAKRHDDKEDPFRWDLAPVSQLKGRGCQLVRINEIGRR